MNGNRHAYESPHSLIDLPLNVLFRVLSYLDLKELQNIANCCKILRILANENLILTNNLIDLNSRRDQWTRRLIFDVFDILNGSRNVILRLTTAYNMSVVESIRIIQKNYELGYSNRSELQGRFCSQSLANEELQSTASIERSDGETRLATKSAEIPPTKNCNIEREKITYLEILQGFHNICAASQEDTMAKKAQEESWEDSEHEISLEENLSENDQDIESDVGTPTQIDKKLFDTTLKQRRTLSPTSSDYSKSSSNSIFSELPPKLSSRGWHSSIYELEHVSDNIHSGSSDDGASSSESIVKLRNSNKVKDKAALFEKLISNDYSITGNQKKLKKKKSYGLLAPTGNSSIFCSLSASFSNSKRSISQGYLEELERCNLIIERIPTSHNEPDEVAHTNYRLGLNRYKDSLRAKNDDHLHTLEHMAEENVKTDYKAKNRRLQRSKLKAFVTEDNKICYEKL